ncbi:zinc-binding alcohol dehydrogenase family protein [Acanthopleuribacter pedis]
MKAIVHREAGPIGAENALVEVLLPKPKPGPHDLLVAVRGVSMNPVDVKVRALMAPEGDHRVLGYDAAGVVEAVGSAVTRFKVGDPVCYAGDLTRPGTNAEYHLVDERIVGRKPESLGFRDAAAIPLTSITAWEMLFDCFGLREGEGEGHALLVIGAAGGVGSMLIQLAKKLTGLTVIATASRPETRAWVERMGADHIINHRRSLDAELADLGVAPRYVAALTHTERHFDAVVKAIEPRGRIAVIDDPPSLDILPLKPKALTVSWEFMFTRPMFQTDDMDVQHTLLNRVADLLDQGVLIPTANHIGGVLNVANLRAAHEHQESGKAIGKTVLDGFVTA